MDLISLEPRAKRNKANLKLVSKSDSSRLPGQSPQINKQAKSSNTVKFENLYCVIPYSFEESPSRPTIKNPEPLVTSLVDKKEQWQQLLDAARAFWWRLSHEELKETNGIKRKLIGLVCSRYYISEYVATEQVKRFYQQTCMC